MILDVSYSTFSCGGVSELPVPIANLISLAISTIKILVPVILIVMGMIDLTRALTKQKDDEIKKAQMLFVKRIISGLLVFFIVAVVQFALGVLSKAADDDSYMDCIRCFVNGVKDTGECK